MPKQAQQRHNLVARMVSCTTIHSCILKTAPTMLSRVCEEKIGTCFDDHTANISGWIKRGHMKHGAIVTLDPVHSSYTKQEDAGHVRQFGSSTVVRC